MYSCTCYSVMWRSEDNLQKLVLPLCVCAPGTKLRFSTYWAILMLPKGEIDAIEHLNAKKETWPRLLAKFTQGKKINLKFVCNNYHLHKSSVNYLNEGHSPFWLMETLSLSPINQPICPILFRESYLTHKLTHVWIYPDILLPHHKNQAILS